MAAPVFRTSDVVLFAAIEIIVERDDPVIRVRKQHLDHVRADVPSATCHYDSFACHR